MAVIFDPAWEYAIGRDPELWGDDSEMLVLEIESFRGGDGKRVNLGFRRGKGHPDRHRPFTLAKAKPLGPGRGRQRERPLTFCRCGKQIAWVSKRCRACSDIHRRKNLHVNMVCAVCGKTFIRRRESHVVCSFKCRWGKPDSRKPVQSRECKGCKKEFQPVTNRTVYCSRKCIIKKGKAKVVRPVRTCLYCSAEYTEKRARRVTMFCCKAHYLLHKKKVAQQRHS